MGDTPLVLATWALVAVTGVLAISTIVLVTAQTRALKWTLRTDALSRLTDRWDSQTMRGRRRHVARLILETRERNEDTSHRSSRTGEVADFFEDVGALLKKGRLDFDLVWQAFSEPAVGWWKACIEEHARQVSKEDNDSAAYSEYKKLVDRLQEEDMRMVPEFLGWRESDILTFLESERDLLVDEPLRIAIVQKA